MSADEKIQWLKKLADLVRVEFFQPEFVSQHVLNGYGGQCFSFPLNGQRIQLADYLSGSDLGAMYLHEIGHAIAAKNRIFETATGDAHNQFFAALVAVMYRRAGFFWRIQVYDFGNGDEGEGRYDNELPARFEFVCRRSAELAPLDLSIEECAAMLHRDFSVSLRPKPILDAQELRAAVAGALLVLCVLLPFCIKFM